MKGKMVLKILSGTVNVVLYSLLACVVFLVISTKASGGEPDLFGYQLKTVLSGSMEPTFKTGSVIAVNPEIEGKTFAEGDIVTFMQDEDTLVTHRIIGVTQNGENTIYETKGDNNDGPDTQPLLAENIVGEYTDFTVPYLGQIITFANSQMGAVVLLIVPGIFLILYSAFTIWRTLSEFVDKKELEVNSKKQDAKAQ